MGIVDGVKEWLLTVALKKAVKAVVAVVVSYAASAKLAPILAALGVTLDPETLTNGLTLFLTAGVTMLLNWIKVKTAKA